MAAIMKDLPVPAVSSQCCLGYRFKDDNAAVTTASCSLVSETPVLSIRDCKSPLILVLKNEIGTQGAILLLFAKLCSIDSINKSSRGAFPVPFSAQNSGQFLIRFLPRPISSSIASSLIMHLAKSSKLTRGCYGYKAKDSSMTLRSKTN